MPTFNDGHHVAVGMTNRDSILKDVLAGASADTPLETDVCRVDGSAVCSPAVPIRRLDITEPPIVNNRSAAGSVGGVEVRRVIFLRLGIVRSRKIQVRRA